MSDLQEMIRVARKELRKASGLPLTPEERDEDLHKAEVEELQKFVLPKLGVGPHMALLGTPAWTSKGAAIILKAEDHIFHLRKAGDRGSSINLFLIEGDGEREIARIEAADRLFASRVLAVIGDVIPSGG